MDAYLIKLYDEIEVKQQCDSGTGDGGCSAAMRVDPLLTLFSTAALHTLEWMRSAGAVEADLPRVARWIRAQGLGRALPGQWADHDARPGQQHNSAWACCALPAGCRCFLTSGLISWPCVDF